LLGARSPCSVSGVEFGTATSGQPGPLYRLERGSTSAEHPLYRLQHAFSDSALGCNILLDLTNYPKTLSLGRPLFEFAGF